MGSRKDIIKRSLGITEYPWSSDDELEAAPATVDETSSSLHRPQAEPRPSANDISRPNGLSPPLSLQHYEEQLQPIDATIHRHSQHQEQHQMTQRSQARQDRDRFWSFIGNPYSRYSELNHRSRLNMIPRMSHTSAPSAGGQPSRRSARTAADLHGIMEFNRLQRNQRHRAYVASVIPVTRASGTTGHGVIRPSDSNPIIMPPRTQGLRLRVTSTQIVPNINNEVAMPSMIAWQQVRDQTERLLARTVGAPGLAPEHPATAERAVPPVGSPRASPAPTLVLSEDDDEHGRARPPQPSNQMPPSFGSEGLPPVPEVAEPDDDTEGVLDSNANVALEEEIVAIDLDNTESSTANTNGDASAGPSAPAGGPDENDGIDGRFTTEDMGGTSGGSGDAAPEQTNHGVKRKRRNSDNNLEPGSVKELNQKLLRLLECPVCLEWMEPPMSQCRRGHLVCGQCRERLSSCPVCRTTFSSVRNRAMEAVAELLRYPCRYGCGQEVRLRRRAPHEASCVARKYHCPLCTESAPLPRIALARHFQGHHLTMMKIGRRHKFSVKVNVQQHENWLLFAMEQYFHLKIDVDIHTWGVVVYVAYIGPKCDANRYTYEVTIDGQHNQRKLSYARTTHSDLESSSLNVRRQDCFHLTLDQALNFIRFKNRHCDSDKLLDFNLEIATVEQPLNMEESDS